MRYDFFFLRVSIKNRNPYLKTLAGCCCAGAFKSGVKGLTYWQTLVWSHCLFAEICGGMSVVVVNQNAGHDIL
jgi:hypothetical protein